jgi:ribulose-5-phosphate 4-epimerase/fuculose-1-phosphate aldolase
MIYQGIKFRTEIIDREVPKDSRLKELKYWCKEFHRYGLAPPYEGGSYGNLSFRVHNGEDPFIITGSRIGLKNKLSDDCFVRVPSCNLGKRIVYVRGAREPSSESMFHFAIYHQRRDKGDGSI